MKTWPSPPLPTLTGVAEPLRLFDTASGEVREVRVGSPATMYVCGITPYDATHLGHAATYVTFDLVARVLRDNGHDIRYAQNITDVDDPLLERAERDGLTWQELAQQGIDLFRKDMAALAVIPPDDYIGVVEAMPLITAYVVRLLEAGVAYRVASEGAGEDIYFDLRADAHFGSVSGWGRDEMLEVFGERGGDPDRAGKRDPLDPLLWRTERPGEPAWDDDVLGRGRPGWHIECTAIALDRLGMGFDVQGGGTDLVFPHHEMSASQGVALTGEADYARHYAHQAMVGYEGTKMSKSLGNLVKVSQLRADGVDPMAIRLVLLAQHYRRDWEYTPELLRDAEKRLGRWRTALRGPNGPDGAQTVQSVRRALADDLDSAAALAVVDAWVTSAESGSGAAGSGTDSSVDTSGAPAAVRNAVSALLGIQV